jgi:hypothetical protein
MKGSAGATAIDAKTAPVTVNVVFALTEPEAAVMVADPVPVLVAKPTVPAALLIVATLDVSLDHCTD